MRPHIAGGEEAASSPDTWMSQAMNMLEEGMTKGLRYQRPENRSGGITEERSVAEHVSLNAKSRRKAERREDSQEE